MFTVLARKLAPLVPLVVSLVGCAQFRKIEECDQLIQRINPTLETLGEVTKKKPHDPESYLLAAKEFERLADDLSKLDVSHPQLAHAVTDYQKLLKNVAKNARIYSKALADQRKRNITTTKVAGSKHVHRQRVIVQRINGVCQPRH